MMRLCMFLALCVPLGAVCGALYNFDNGERQMYIGLGAGALDLR